MTNDPSPRATDTRPARREREAKALRENLRRRKARDEAPRAADDPPGPKNPPRGAP